MKNVCLLLSACLLMTASCSKSYDDKPTDNGCITQIGIKQSDPGLDVWKTRVADSLMNANHIDHSHDRYFQLDTSTFQNNPTPYAIRVDQYTNGLRIFNSERIYLFYKNGGYYQGGYDRTKGTLLSNKPTMSLPTLRALFTADLKKNAATVTPHLTDSCYKAEFGYYNLSNDNQPESLVRAWRVTINHSPALWYAPFAFGYPYDGYPVGFYKDNGELLGFGGNLIAID